MAQAGVQGLLVAQRAGPARVALADHAVLLHGAAQAVPAHGAGLAAGRDPQGLRWEGLEVLQLVVDAHLVDAAVEAAQRPVGALAQGGEARGGRDACGRDACGWEARMGPKDPPLPAFRTSPQSENVSSSRAPCLSSHSPGPPLCKWRERAKTRDLVHT